jgi:hypothetical protein
MEKKKPLLLSTSPLTPSRTVFRIPEFHWARSFVFAVMVSGYRGHRPGAEIYAMAACAPAAPMLSGIRTRTQGSSLWLAPAGWFHRHGVGAPGPLVPADATQRQCPTTIPTLSVHSEWLRHFGDCWHVQAALQRREYTALFSRAFSLPSVHDTEGSIARHGTRKDYTPFTEQSAMTLRIGPGFASCEPGRMTARRSSLGTLQRCDALVAPENATRITSVDAKQPGVREPSTPDSV